jgi:hypothetical protein
MQARRLVEFQRIDSLQICNDCRRRHPNSTNFRDICDICDILMPVVATVVTGPPQFMPVRAPLGSVGGELKTGPLAAD